MRVGFGRAQMRLVAVLAGLVLSFGVVACGSDDEQRDGSSAGSATVEVGGSVERQITAAYEGFIDALARRRWKQACAVYSSDYRRSYPGQVGLADTCVGTLEAEYGPLKEVERPRVVDVRVVGGSRGVVFVRTRARGNTTPLAVVKEGGSWKLAGLDDSATRYGTSNDPYAK